MPLLLHLTDLHLGTSDPEIDEYKAEVIPAAERQTRQDMLKRTLRLLGNDLRKKGTRLDAILVTGDISYGNEEAGFEAFSGLIGQLGDAAPSRSRIAVIPGNHDVEMGTPASSPARYANFLKYIRKARFVTPLLDGIDFSGKKKVEINPRLHCILDLQNNWLAIPINSANYCHVVESIDPVPESIWQKLQDDIHHLDPKVVDRKTAERVLKKLRLHDMARVSPTQFEALQNLVERADQLIKAGGKDPKSFIRIAMLHHHLLPVSTLEEVKKFESFTNLGLLRHFLAAHHFNIALHGHKHVGKIYWDSIPATEDLSPASVHKVLVVSGGTLGGPLHSKEDCCRLIELSGPIQAPELTIASIPGLDPGAPMGKLEWRQFALWESDGKGAISTRIVGSNLSEVYERVLAHFRTLPPDRGVAFNLICQIDDPSSALTIPEAYPDVPSKGQPDKQSWFEELVRWWQHRQPTIGKTLPFTHGKRIFAYDGKSGSIDQLSKVTLLLSKSPYSSRGIITLCSPELDRVDNQKYKFPSFCSVHFLVRKRVGQHPVFDCTAYFRKQEMKYWWPINIAELATLQKEVYQSVRTNSEVENLELGSITTISALAKIGTSPPQALVPAVDRALDESPELLWTMVYALFWKSKAARKNYYGAWENIMAELVPEQTFNPDGVPVPLSGLTYLLNTLKLFNKHHTSEDADRLAESLENLRDCNEKYVDELYDDKVDLKRHHEWCNTNKKHLAAMRRAINSIFGENKPQRRTRPN